MKVKTAGSVLAYNFGKEKLLELETVCRKQGVRVKVVEPIDFNKPVGAMMGFDIPDYTGTDYEFEDEMMVLYNLAGSALDKFLKALRVAEISVPLKAVLTASNQGWIPAALAAELKEEHEMMRKTKTPKHGE